MNIPLSQETFVLLRDMIYKEVGLFFADSKKYLLQSRLQARLSSVRCRSFEDYYKYLQFDPGRQKEYVELNKSVTTTETYFFRDQRQIDCFQTYLLPRILKEREKEKKLRIWSAGCSSGDEAYTMAMVMAEHAPSLSDWNVEVLATDINEQILATARAGIYSRYAIRNVPPEWLKKHFTETDGEYRIKSTLRKWLRFSTLNLFDSRHMQTMKDIDLVLCRNVLIYFDDEGRKKIVSGFYNSLRPNGSFVIGFSESLRDLADLFRSEPWNNTMVYFKTERRGGKGPSPKKQDVDALAELGNSYKDCVPVGATKGQTGHRK